MNKANQNKDLFKADEIRTLLIGLFNEIETKRMEGIPILNKKLSVDAVGFEQYGKFALGVLITPWFMNLMMLPIGNDNNELDGKKVGLSQAHTLPNGTFQFIVGYEQAIGFYLSCSLFSPMFEFGDQEAALQTAKAALAEVLKKEDQDALDEDADMKAIWAGKIPEKKQADEAELEQDAEKDQNQYKGSDSDQLSDNEIGHKNITAPDLRGRAELSRRELLLGFRKQSPKESHLDEKCQS